MKTESTMSYDVEILSEFSDEWKTLASFQEVAPAYILLAHRVGDQHRYRVVRAVTTKDVLAE